MWLWFRCLTGRRILQLLILFVILVCTSTHLGQIFGDSAHALLTAWWPTVLLTLVVGPVSSTWLVTRLTLRRTEPAAEAQIASRAALALWSAASLFVASVAGWPTVVREHWGLGNWVIADELLILLPIAASLTLVLATFFGQGTLRQRLAIVWTMGQVLLALPMIPMLYLWAANDVNEIFLTDHPRWRFITIGAALVGSAAMMPWLLRQFFTSQPVCDVKLLKKVVRIEQQMNVRVASVRIWKTGGAICNALVTGMTKRTRTIWLSQSLLQNLPDEEVDVVLRHEFGHARRWHVLQRMFLVGLPFLLAAVVALVFPSAIQRWSNRLADQGLSLVWQQTVLLPTLAISVGVLLMSWVSQQTELDADIEATLADASWRGDALSLDEQRVERLVDGLVAVSVFNGTGIRKRTLLHPSLVDRVQFLRSALHLPERISTFRQRYFWFYAATVVVTLSVFATLTLV